MGKQIKVYEIRAAYEAGAAQFQQWSSGETVHRGIGWLHPFGPSSYVAGNGFTEEKDFDPDQLFSPYWDQCYGTRLFCIYHLKDGDIYAYDGMFAVRDETDATREYGRDEDHLKPTTPRRDVLVNVIVGGTGRYRGAAGLMMGTAEGAGAQRDIEGNRMPDVIMKMMSGYIKIPVEP